jgi:ribosomal protein S8
MFLNKINKLIYLLNQSKNSKKPYFYILKTPELLKVLYIFQKERCINFFILEKRHDNIEYFKVYINMLSCIEIFTFVSNLRYYSCKVSFLKIYKISNLKMKLYINTKKGLICDSTAINKNVGGTLYFGLKYL